MKHKWTGAVGAIAAFVVGIATAADGDKPGVTVETVYTGLDRPCGVAVQPGTGNVLVSESGAGQIVRFLPTELGKPTVAIAGFPRSASGKGPMDGVGPLGLAFLHQNLIVVGGSERKDGEDVIRVYELPGENDADKGPLNFKAAKRTINRAWTGETKSAGQTSFWAMAMSPSALWMTSHGDGGNDSVLRAGIADNALEELVPFLRTKEATQLDGPMGIAVRSSRDFLVVGFVGKFDESADSVLAFLRMASGTLMIAQPIGLRDVVGLEYSPKSNRLYAVDLAWASPKDGGVYRLDSAIIDGRVGVKLVKLASLERPTSLAFAPDNTLYVTAMGADDSDAENADSDAGKRGVLVKITGDL